MELVEFGPDDAAHVGAFVDVVRAVDEVDCPWEPRLTVHRLETVMRHGWDGEPGRWFLTYDGSVPVAAASIDTSEHDNLEMAWLSVRVSPGHRRRGHGSAMLRRVEELAVEMGRPLFHIGDWVAPATKAFAAVSGYEQRSVSIRRMQVVRDAPDPALLREEARSRASDYDLVRVDGPSPDDLLPDLVAITEAINDAPLDDLEWEDEVYSPERVRAYEQAQIAGSNRFRRLLARHRDTGELAGHTVVVVDAEQPAIAEQHDTSVVAAHRGHQLGLLLKAEMLLWLADEEPQLERIYTWNAESNRHMIGVNERLGYRPVGRGLEFQRRFR
jgi:RimJ/RimL family protein N-acetyltransferase